MSGQDEAAANLEEVDITALPPGKDPRDSAMATRSGNTSVAWITISPQVGCRTEGAEIVAQSLLPLAVGASFSILQLQLDQLNRAYEGAFTAERPTCTMSEPLMDDAPTSIPHAPVCEIITAHQQRPTQSPELSFLLLAVEQFRVLKRLPRLIFIMNGYDHLGPIIPHRVRELFLRLNILT